VDVRTDTATAEDRLIHPVNLAVPGRALVDAVSVEVETGRMTILIGPNGAGKSTLIRLMSGELPPSSGAIMCEGENVARFSPGQLALGVRTRTRIVERCLDIADALHLASRPYTALSGGEQRRFQFARVLAQIEAARTVHDRQALLLDEPVANLDLPHQLALLDAAQRAVARGVAVLAVLHDLNLAARYADTLAIMDKGAIVAFGAPAAVQTSGLLSEVFGVELVVGTKLVSETPVVLPSRWLAANDARASRHCGAASTS
jgi:iron complex transport system ATP-binding protein